MKRRIVTATLAAALVLAGATYVADWWHLRSGVAVPAGTNDGGYMGVVGVGGPDVDKSALAKVKTLEDFKNVPGLRFDSSDPTPSAGPLPGTP